MQTNRYCNKKRYEERVFHLKENIIIFGDGPRGRELFNWKDTFFDTETNFIYVDNDVKKWGRDMLGGMTHNPEYVKQFDKDIKIVIATLRYQEVANQLMGWGYHNLWFMYKSNEIFLEKYTPDCEHLGAAYTIKNNVDLGNIYDLNRTEQYTERLFFELDKAETFVDVGAEFGYYSYVAAKKGVKRIHAYEASKYRYNTLKTVYGNIPQIQLHHNAISDKRGTAVFHQVIPSKLAHHGYSPSMDGSLSLWRNLKKIDENAETVVETFEVESIPLDALLETEKQIDIIKMDIEGAEVFAFRGMREILKQGKTKIFLEVHSPAIEAMSPGGMEEMTDIVKSAGYTIYETKGMYLKEVPCLIRGRYYLAPPNCKH